VIFLDADDLLHVARRAIQDEVVVRDRGLLESASFRPQATAFGEDAYPRLEDKAAALMHSLARSNPLVDGNKRLALSGTIAFLGVNGRQLTLSNDEAYDLVIEVATGELDDVTDIADRLLGSSRPGTDP
jgi:death-on-curing protein